MVDAMGVTGVEGVFRRTCETTLGVLRNERSALVSVLQTFVYDPLVEWAPKKSKSGQVQNDEAMRIMQNIDNRLRGKNSKSTKGRCLCARGSRHRTDGIPVHVRSQARRVCSFSCASGLAVLARKIADLPARAPQGSRSRSRDRWRI